MNIYLDESYNLQKDKGKMFLSINGFSVLNEKTLRKRWKNIRKPHIKSRRRIHATDDQFEGLRKKSIKLLGSHDANILSVFQLIQELPYEYFEEFSINFDQVYAGLLKKLFHELSLGEYQRVKIIIDARKHKGGRMVEKAFRKNIEDFLSKEFPKTAHLFKPTPSYLDVLVELADFVSNTFYKEYQKESQHIFEELGFRLVKIKNPL